MYIFFYLKSLVQSVYDCRSYLHKYSVCYFTVFSKNSLVIWMGMALLSQGLKLTIGLHVELRLQMSRVICVLLHLALWHRQGKLTFLLFDGWPKLSDTVVVRHGSETLIHGFWRNHEEKNYKWGKTTSVGEH